MGVSEADLDRLFSLPLDEFVVERKRIARTLAQAGQKDDARAVDKIARPSVSAWVVNQVARRDPTLVRRLGELTERLRGSQGRSPASGGPDDFAAMTAEHRQALGTLRDMVDEVLVAAGNDASPQLVRRVITNLRAGVADAETRPLVERGRLVRDVEEADFTTLFEALPPHAPASAERPAARRPPPPAPPMPSSTSTLPTPISSTSDDESASADMAAERAAREEQRAREKARASAERRLVRLREAAATAREALTAEERTVAAARAALATKEEHLERVRATSEKAAADVADVEAELERLGPG